MRFYRHFQHLVNTSVHRVPSFFIDAGWISFIAAVTIWGYYDILDDFFVMDDITLILHAFSVEGLLKHFRYGMGGGFYRPLINLVFMWDFYWWEWNPLGYHLSNMFFHIINATLVYGITKRLTRSSFTSLTAGLLFGLHGSHPEAVTWISGRMDVVCTTFFLISVFAFILFCEASSEMEGHLHSKTIYWLSVFSFACALLTKEMAVTLPMILILYEIVFMTPRRLNVRSQVRTYAPYLMLFGAYFALRFFLFHGLGGYRTKLFGTFLIDNLVIFFKYFTMPFQDVIFSFPFAMNVIMILIAILVCLGVSKISRFTILWMLITLLPVSAFAVRRGAYLASVGCCILFAQGLTFSLSQFPQLVPSKNVQRIFFISQILIITALCCEYAVYLKIQNAWWSNIAEMNADVPQMVKTLYPKFPEQTRLCFRMRVVFNQRLASGFVLQYPEMLFEGIHFISFDRCAENATAEQLERTYFFHYNQEEKFISDLSYEIREKIKHREHLKIINIEQRPHILSNRTRRLSVQLNPAMPVTSLGIVTSLANGIHISEGQILARGQVEDVEGKIEVFEIMAGADVAEWAFRFPEVQAQVEHSMPQVYQAWIVRRPDNTLTIAQNYIKKFTFQTPLVPKNLSFEWIESSSLPDNTSLDVKRVILYSD